MMKTPKKIGGIEGGGTKFNVIIVEEPTGIPDNPPQILAKAQFPTTTPDQTIEQVASFLQSEAGGHLQAVGLACFGPLDLDPGSPGYGQITSTPKPGWGDSDIPNQLEETLQVPVYVDTDVNGAALGEYLWGAGQGVPNLLYLTVGTGIGGGMLVEGVPLHGLTHPEMGHVSVPHDWDKDPFNGSCPYHGDCLEGLAAGPALLERWHASGESLPKDHPAWALEAEYLAAALANYVLTLSPQRMILGGGIMRRTNLFPMIRTRVLGNLNNYILHSTITDHIDKYIVPPGLVGNSGTLGAVGLALINR
jgi:fructokinase